MGMLWQGFDNHNSQRHTGELHIHGPTAFDDGGGGMYNRQAAAPRLRTAHLITNNTAGLRQAVGCTTATTATPR